MPRAVRDKSIYRIIDANINRAKEGLRVCEEVTRFIINDYKLTSEFKFLRHKIDRLVKAFDTAELVKARSAKTDVGQRINKGELKRRDCRDIFLANTQRIKESLRVLEEFSKLINKAYAVKFKALRYDIYEIEKKAAKRIAALYNFR